MRTMFTAALAKRTTPVIFATLIAVAILFAVIQTLQAQELEQLPPDLSGSSKAADSDDVFAGDQVQFTIVISNSGSEPATGVWMTDVLPAELSYVTDTLSVQGNVGLYGESGGTITWTGVVNNNDEIVMHFEALVDALVTPGSQITNTALVAGDGSVWSPSAVLTVVSEPVTSTVYLPILARNTEAPFLNPIPPANANNQWTVSWFVSKLSGISGFELQESFTPDFSDPTTIDVGLDLSYLVARQPSFNNVFYYRVRANSNSGPGPWSNVESVIGGYFDGFDNDGTGWEMRRQDTDTVANQVYYRNGHLVLEMDSGYDYLLAAPLAPAPPTAYQIDSRIRLVGQDNTHAYGLVFGGDWNGEPCPNEDYSSCFNQYYRLLVVWAGNLTNAMRVQLKRIDFHDPVNNTGGGVDLMPWRNVPVNFPPEDYQTWSISVTPDGQISIFVNGNLIQTVTDTTYVDQPYFAAFAAVDEYTGLEAEFDYYQVLSTQP